MYANVFKRFFDIVFSIILMPFFLIIYIVVGIAIKLDDGGPIFYCGERLGRYGKSFKMYKFRSMKVNAPDWRLEDGSTFNAEDDPRQTRVGKFLRKTSIDEIPQLLNIIKGEMSFIGPRPDLLKHMELYEGNEVRKLEIRPGVTGYNQAYFRNTIPWKERIKNDIYYIDHLTMWMDIKVFFKTVVSVLKREDVFIEQKLENKNGEKANV